MSIKGRFKVFGLLLVTAGVVSCIPVQSTFFQPSGSGGKVVGNACHGRIGRMEVFRFQHDDRVIVKAKLGSDDKQATSLFVSFSFVNPDTLKPYAPLMQILLPTDEFKIEIEGREELLRLVSVHTRMEDLPPNDSLLLESYGGMSYWIKLKPSSPIAYAHVNEFTLLFPALLIDGEPVTFAPIKWTLIKDQLRMRSLALNC